MKANIYKNYFETIVINYLGEDIGYIVKGKTMYTVSIYGRNYTTKLSNRLKLSGWINELIEAYNLEHYSILVAKRRGFKIKG